MHSNKPTCHPVLLNISRGDLLKCDLKAIHLKYTSIFLTRLYADYQLKFIRGLMFFLDIILMMIMQNLCGNIPNSFFYVREKVLILFVGSIWWYDYILISI